MTNESAVEEDLLRVRDLTVDFAHGQALLKRNQRAIHAVRGVNLTVRRGESVSLVGESGSGKSTTGRAILRLLEAQRGEILFHGAEVRSMSRGELHYYRRCAQMIFQDPFGSLNPKMTIGETVEEPMIVHQIGDRHERRARAEELLGQVGLDARAFDRFPREFSGGQRQRISIARALAVSPELIVCDEPTSALDVSIQAQILNLLGDLRQELGLSYLVITHNLSIVATISDWLAVMYAGRIVEFGRPRTIFVEPRHPYTKVLIAAIPDPSKKVAVDAIAMDKPDTTPAEGGCAYRRRCPLFNLLGQPEICSNQEPLAPSGAFVHESACHFPDKVGEML